MDKSFVGRRIYELRENQGISARQMAFDLGLSNSYITQVESNTKTPSLDVFFDICDYFHIDPATLFMGFDLKPKVRKMIPVLDKLDDDQLDAIQVIINSYTKCK